MRFYFNTNLLRNWQRKRTNWFRIGTSNMCFSLTSTRYPDGFLIFQMKSWSFCLNFYRITVPVVPHQSDISFISALIQLKFPCVFIILKSLLSGKRIFLPDSSGFQLRMCKPVDWIYTMHYQAKKLSNNKQESMCDWMIKAFELSGMYNTLNENHQSAKGKMGIIWYYFIRPSL